MSWPTPPHTWVDSELVNAALMNPQVRDALSYLINRPGQVIKRINAASYTTASTTFVDIDATNLIITLVNAGSMVMVSFLAKWDSANVGLPMFDFVINGTRYGAANTQGIMKLENVSGPMISYCVPAVVTPGTNVFKPQFATISGTTGILSTAATVPVIFGVQEIA